MLQVCRTPGLVGPTTAPAGEPCPSASAFAALVLLLLSLLCTAPAACHLASWCRGLSYAAV